MRIGGLTIGGRLDRQALSLHLALYLVTLGAMLVLFIILDIALKLKEFLPSPNSDDGLALGLLVRYYVSGLPMLFLQIAPLVTFFSAGFGFARFVRTREWVATMAAGIPTWRATLPWFLVAGLSAATMVFLREGISERLSFEREQAFGQLTGGLETADSDDGLWLRAEGRAFVHVASFESGGKLDDGALVTQLVIYRRGQKSWTTLRAKSASFEAAAGGDFGEGRWRVVECTRRELGSSQLVGEQVEGLQDLGFLPSDVAMTQKVEQRPQELSHRELKRSLSRDPSNPALRTLLVASMLAPLANLELLLLCLPMIVAWGAARTRAGLVAGSFLALTFFIVDLTARDLGMGAILAPLIAASLAHVVFGSLGMVLWIRSRS